jgi:hypothetical protein
MSTTSFFRVCWLALAVSALAACNSDDESTGQISVAVTDSPVDYADVVVVQFTGVELKPKDGPAFSRDFETPKTIDLLAYQGQERAMLLDGEEVPAGEYTWMRLNVLADPDVAGDSYIMIDGAECELRIPSGEERGLQMIRGFTVGVGTTTDFTVDFNLRHSVLKPPGQATELPVCDGQAYQLKPVLRVVQFRREVLVTPDDDDLVWDDVNGDNALTSAMVDENSFSYTIGFVPAGEYRLAYTCDKDDPEVDANEANLPVDADEVVRFTPADGVAVTVTAGQTATVNFPPQ